MKGNKPQNIIISTALQHAHFQLLFQSINGCYAHSTPVCSTTHGCRWLFFFPILFCDLALVWNSTLDVHDQASDMRGKVLLVIKVLKSSQGIRASLSIQPVTQTAMQHAEWIHGEGFKFFIDTQAQCLGLAIYNWIPYAVLCSIHFIHNLTKRTF